MTYPGPPEPQWSAPQQPPVPGYQPPPAYMYPPPSSLPPYGAYPPQQPPPPYPPTGYYAPYPTAAKPSPVPGWLLFAASLAAGIGTLLPWANVSIFGSTVSLNGSSTGDGKLYLGAAVVCAIFAALIAAGQLYKLFAIITLLGGALIAFGGSYDRSRRASSRARPSMKH